MTLSIKYHSLPDTSDSLAAASASSALSRIILAARGERKEATKPVRASCSTRRLVRLKRTFHVAHQLLMVLLRLVQQCCLL
jgi:hypothetical protein